MSKVIARVFSREFKLEVVRRMEAGTNISALARELGIRRKLLNQWRDAFRRGGPAALRGVGRPRKASLASDPPPTRPLRRTRWGARGSASPHSSARSGSSSSSSIFKRALRQVEASRRPSDGPGATASTPSSRR